MRIYEKNIIVLSGLIQNVEPNWQLLGKMSIFNEDFGFSMPSLSLTPGPDLALHDKGKYHIQKI